MARSRSRNWTISSPGRLPDRVAVFDLPSGATIDLAEVTIEGSVAGLTGENAELNVATYTDSNGVEHAVGTVVLFDVVAEENITPNHSELISWSEATAYRIYVRYKTDDQPDHQDLTYEIIVEVYTAIPMVQ